MTLNRSENEPSVQEQIFQTLLRTPHHSVDEVLHIHREQLERDPYLYGQLAVHAVLEGQCAVRDIQDVFVSVLFTSDFLEHRHAAWVMLQDLPPHRVTRVLSYITGYDERLTHCEGIGGNIDDPISPAFGVKYERAHYGKSHHDPDKRGKEKPVETKPVSQSLRRHLKTSANRMIVTRYIVHHDCLNKWTNRIVQSAVKNYLRYREHEDNRPLLEGALVRMGGDMLTLYKKMHVKPSDLVQKALFENSPPEGSRMDAMKRLVAETDPTVQAEIIIDAKLPYPVIRTLVPVTPSTQVASVAVMTPQELMANLGKLKRDGAFDNAELKEMIQAKLKKVKTARRDKVDAFKGDIAASAVAGLDEETKKLVTDVTDAQLKLHGEICVPTVIWIDKSWSMASAIEMGMKLGAAIGQAGGKNFKGGWLFGTEPRRIKFAASEDVGSYAVWKKKLRMQRADGGTDLGACIPAMIRDGVDAEQIVIITDEDENGRPYLYQKMPLFEAKFGHLPNVVIVRIGQDSCNKVERTLKTIGVQVDVMDVNNIDKISIPNLLQLLSRKSVFDLIQEIMDLSMPTPEGWKKNHQPKRRNAEKVLA